MKKKNKFLVTVFIVLIITNIVNPISRSLAYNIGNDINLTGYGSVECHVRNGENGDYAITTDLVGYYDNGNFYPAYCLNRGVNGADNSYMHTVNISQLLENDLLYNKVWRVARAGYPYHTAEELGVDDWTYAYQATKTAIYDVLGQTDVENYYGIDEIGNRTVDLMKRLVYEGENGIETYHVATASINKSGNIVLEGEYYIQNYFITTNVAATTYKIAITGFPVGTKVTDSSGVEKTQFKKAEPVQIRIPKESVETQDIKGKILAEVNTKSYAIFYGKTYDANLQNYAITADPITLTNASTNLELKANTASIKIRKVDEDTKKAIQGTEYELFDNKGVVIAKGITDENGNLIFNDLYQEEYTVKEIKSNDDYVISKESINIKAIYNKITEVVMTNEHKKGSIKIHKVDKDNNEIALGNVTFDLYSYELGKVIATYRTDANGEILIENLRTGKYKIIERNTNKWYNLAEETDIEVEWNTTTPVTVENELKKGQVKIVKVDKENNEIKLENVKFEVLDTKGKVLETIVTNEKGEAYTSKYPIRDYKTITLKEIETQEEYSINDIPQKIILKENEITTIQLENEVKKGQIKVIKIDKDNNKIKLEGVKFGVYDEEDKLVQTLITDANGEAITERLRINKTYYIKELETKENYKLNEETITITLKENEIKSVLFENEKKKGQIQIIKVDSENNEIYIPNVTFEIYDKDNNKVDTIITNSQGKATTKKLPIDSEYIIKEVATKEEYILSEEVKTITIEENKIAEVFFENSKKYGKIKINKISNKYSKILNLPENSPIANTKFLILNESGENMGIYTTDETGSVTTDKLPYGEYTVYEYETPEHFLKDAEPQKVSIIENNQTIELTFKNTPKEPELPKTGF